MSEAAAPTPRPIAAATHVLTPTPTGAAPPGSSPFWHAPWEFAVHTLVGTSIFAIIAVAAVLLNLGVHQLKAFGSDRVIIIGLMAGEYALFSVDLLLYGIFLFRTAKQTIKRL